MVILGYVFDLISDFKGLVERDSPEIEGKYSTLEQPEWEQEYQPVFFQSFQSIIF